MNEWQRKLWENAKTWLEKYLPTKLTDLFRFVGAHKWHPCRWWCDAIQLKMAKPLWQHLTNDDLNWFFPRSPMWFSIHLSHSRSLSLSFSRFRWLRLSFYIFRLFSTWNRFIKLLVPERLLCQMSQFWWCAEFNTAANFILANEFRWLSSSQTEILHIS